jgi:hypothetical protein
MISITDKLYEDRILILKIDKNQIKKIYLVSHRYDKEYLIHHEIPQKSYESSSIL